MPFLRFILETLCILLISYGFLREDVLAEWERKQLKRLRKFIKHKISQLETR